MYHWKGELSMKRVSKILALAMMMTMLLGLTAQASSSTTTTTTPSPAASSSSAASGTSVAYASGVTTNDDTLAIYSVSEGIRNEAQAYATQVVGPNASILKIFDVVVKSGGFPRSVTFNIAGVVAGQNITVLHKGDNGWEVVPCTVGNGTVTATFNDLSPVAIVTNATSAKTADSVSWIAVCAVICLAGAVVFGRKAKRI